MKKAIIILIALLSASCIQLQDAASESFKYSFSEGFCSTGEKSFSNLNQMCTALQNNAYNNGCAQAQRQNYFYSRCSGSWTPSSTTVPLFKIQFN